MTKQAALATAELRFSFKVLKEGAVDNSWRRQGTEEGSPAHLARFHAVIPGPTLQTGIIRNGRKIP
jgi:hypothetical protein